MLPPPDQLLPRCVTIVIAASIAGLSPQTFKQTILDAGRVTTEDGQVTLASLAGALGKPIDLGDYLRAERSRDPARSYQRDYRRNH